tara:strand:+ start:41654 stop:43270 length:1617 start_codon:yes stop_codon:yes gene_type:complete
MLKSQIEVCFSLLLLIGNVINASGQIDEKSLFGLNEEKAKQLINRGYVEYSDFGAVGDAKVNDFEAIIMAHNFANKYNIEVMANEGATYYIGDNDLTANIQTTTSFGSATFIIDDRKVINRKASIFEITSRMEPYKIDYASPIKKNQKKLEVLLSTKSLIAVSNRKRMHYIRLGLNQNQGSSQTDIFLVDNNGFVNSETPIIWNFNEITEMKIIPIDTSTIKISGGRFITKANQSKSEYNYFRRNIVVERSHVIIDGLEHYIEGEGLEGAPYLGFVSISNAYNVIIQNTLFTGHKKYSTIGAQGKPVSMGSYDITVNKGLNISFINCNQTNDINDDNFWGLMASNYSKNLSLENCKFSRFDAHMGVNDATIRNSTLGYMGINAIGSGTLLVENSEVRARNLINFRKDYGSTWQGELVIRNCIFKPVGKKISDISLFSGYNTGQHDFGYACYMPKSIHIENLHIYDCYLDRKDFQLTIFTDFNEEMVNDTYNEQFPYITTQRLTLINVTSSNQKTLKISDNNYMFRNLIVEGNTEYVPF